MIRDGHDDSVNFFTGVEVEHTPAHGLKTLFVVGVQSFEQITEHLHGCEHIYFGANMSFATPMAYKTNLLVMTVGGYTFKDFLKVGIPLTLIMWVSLSWLIPIFYDI